jgi:hypothetical protein
MGLRSQIACNYRKKSYAVDFLTRTSKVDKTDNLIYTKLLLVLSRTREKVRA